MAGTGLMLMLMLHWLPQLTRQDGPIRSDVLRVTGQEPMSIEAFVSKHRDAFARLDSGDARRNAR